LFAWLLQWQAAQNYPVENSLSPTRLSPELQVEAHDDLTNKHKNVAELSGKQFITFSTFIFSDFTDFSDFPDFFHTFAPPKSGSPEYLWL
jgi:hypothetical protein